MTASELLEKAFQGTTELEYPSTEARYRYKKKSGSSDTNNERDEFE